MASIRSTLVISIRGRTQMSLTDWLIFTHILLRKVCNDWNDLLSYLRSLEAVVDVTNRHIKTMYDFAFVFYCNYDSTVYRYRDISICLLIESLRHRRPQTTSELSLKIKYSSRNNSACMIFDACNWLPWRYKYMLYFQVFVPAKVSTA